MKVLFHTYAPSPYRVQFFNELSRYCELIVLYEIERDTERDDRWKNKKEGEYKAIYLRRVVTIKNQVFCPDIVRYVRKNQDAIIVISGYGTLTAMYAIQYLRLKKLPFVLNCDGGLVKKDKYLIGLLKRYLISSVPAFLSPGEKCSDFLIHYGAVKKSVFYYPFTSLQESDIMKAPIESIQKAEIKKQLGILEDKVVVSVGRYIYIKGFDVLLHASNKIDRETGIYIIGGKATKEFLALKEMYGLEHVHFIDFMLKDDIKKYYMAADLFVLPTRGDVWGLVINEAMACGLPVITTDRCGAGLELIENGVNGYLTPVEDASILADRIQAVLGDEEIRKTMSKNNLKKIEKYTVENMARENIRILKELSEDKFYCRSNKK